MTSFEDLHLATKRHENYLRFYPHGKDAALASSSPKRQKQSPPRVFALDCEMIMTKPMAGTEGEDYTLARASLVELTSQNELVERMDVFVKIPSHRIVTDRLEHVSGITQEHLDSATMSVPSVVARLNEFVDLDMDFVIGHSLNNDLSMLPGWLPARVIETSFLFKVTSHPRLTLGLKDALLEAVGETIHANHGFAHDSVQDAMACLKICRALVAKGTPTCELTDVPARFRKQIMLHRIPREAEVELTRLLTKLPKGKFHHKPVKWSPDGQQGSVCIEFDTDELAEHFFYYTLNKVNENQCHVDGYPYNKLGHLRKLILLGNFECDATSHVKTLMNRRMEFTCQQNQMGKILGKQGKQILHIQRTSGVIISNTQHGKQIKFEILSNDTSKCEVALMKLSLAQQGKYDVEL
ncbi:hypothetical protein BASA81_003045 [Batrachochytrium salamandrivorans]|nr:hypothetical protein BASA81_003045 [Batrachochytrium salamandrivorans]